MRQDEKHKTRGTIQKTTWRHSGRIKRHNNAAEQTRAPSNLEEILQNRKAHHTAPKQEVNKTREETATRWNGKLQHSKMPRQGRRWN